MAGTEMAQYTDAEGEIVFYAKHLESIPFLTDEAMQAAMVARVFAAPSLEEAMQVTAESDGFAEYSGIPLIVHGAGLRPSNIDGKKGIFAVVDCEVKETKEPVVITTGATHPLAIIARAMAEGKLPLEVKPYEAVPTVKGRSGQLFLLTADGF